jgi:hypothetical protein
MSGGNGEPWCGAMGESRCLSVSATFRLMAATSLLGLLVFIPVPAKAADVSPDEMTEEPVLGGPYFSVTGAFLFNESDENLSFDAEDDKVGDLEALQPGDDGWLAGVALGAPIDPTWDWKISGHAVWLSDDEGSSLIPNEADSDQFASNDLDYQYADVELGYRAAPNFRLFGGVRFLHAENDIHYDYLDEGKIGTYDHENEVFAIGPRIGVNAEFPLGDTGLQLVSSASGSVLFGKFERDFSFFEERPIGDASGSDSSSDHGTIFNLEGLAAFRFNLGESATLDLGYRAQHWWNMLDSVFEAQSGDGDFEDGGRTDVFVHGPFATFTVKVP